MMKGFVTMHALAKIKSNYATENDALSSILMINAQTTS